MSEENVIKAEFNRDAEGYTGDPIFPGAAIGLLKKQAGSDANYRAILEFLTGKTSAKLLSDAQLYSLCVLVRPEKPEGGKWQSGRADLGEICEIILRTVEATRKASGTLNTQIDQ